MTGVYVMLMLIMLQLLTVGCMLEGLRRRMGKLERRGTITSRCTCPQEAVSDGSPQPETNDAEFRVIFRCFGLIVAVHP